MLSAARAEALRETGHAGAVVADLHAFYRRFHLEVYGHDDTPVHDALAVAHVIDPEILHTTQLNVELDVTQGPCRGRTVVDQLRRTDRPAERARRRRGGRRPLHRPADRADRLAGLSELPVPAPARRRSAALRPHGVPRLGARARRGPAAHRRRRPRARTRRARHLRGGGRGRAGQRLPVRRGRRAAARPVLALAARRAARPVARLRPGAFAWTDNAFRTPGLHDAVIYELHVGTFSPEGTFDGRDPVPAGARRPGRDRARADARGRVPRQPRLELRRRLPERRPVLLRRPGGAPAARRRRARRRPGGGAGRGLQPHRRLRQQGGARLRPVLHAQARDALGRVPERRRRALRRRPRVGVPERGAVGARLPLRRPAAGRDPRDRRLQPRAPRGRGRAARARRSTRARS